MLSGESKAKTNEGCMRSPLAQIADATRCIAMDKTKWTDVAIVFLTVGIVSLALWQTIVFREQARIFDLQLREMHDSGTDTHDLAVAAKAQADAAKASADSTKEIAQRALAQAAATNDLAKQARRQADIASSALNSNIESAKQDRRPWVGLQLLQCNGCKTESDGSLFVGDLSAVVINTGKTPAIDMIVKWTLISTKASDPIPTYDFIEKEDQTQRGKLEAIPPNLPPEMAASMAKTMALVDRRIRPPREVLAPNAARGITIVAGLKQGRNMMGRMEDQSAVYGLGKITYYDPSRTIQHTTTFCVMNEGFGAVFRYCPTGNEMN